MAFLSLLEYNYGMAANGDLKRRKRMRLVEAHGPSELQSIMLIASSGATDEELAKVCGVTVDKLRRWRIHYPSLDEAILKGRLYPDRKVLESLYVRAVGQEYDEISETVKTEKVRAEDGSEESVVSTSRSVTKKKVLGDVGAQRVWLNARNPMFKETKEVRITIGLGAKLEQAMSRLASLVPAEAIDVTPTPALELSDPEVSDEPDQSTD